MRDAESTSAPNPDSLAVGPIGIPALPPKPKSGITFSGSARLNTSGSSREQSDDESNSGHGGHATLVRLGSDDDDVEVESGSNTAPGDIKRMRR